MSCSAQPESSHHCSSAADDDGQPLRSFYDIPLNALSTIHDILMSMGRDKAGFCAQHRDAASFRSACKAFHSAASWPDALKLAFSKPLSQGACESLGTMLSQPSAATAQLSLRLCIPESGHAGSANFHTAANNPGQWIFSLAALGQRVSRLEMPAVVSAESIISEVSCVLPCLRELVLHCSEEADTFKSLPSFEYEPESLADSRLRIVTLTVPPGQPPFVISGHDRFLDLNYLPELEHVLLSGPIVKSDDIEEDRFLFELPLHTKVTVTPGLEGRVPTRWARTQTTYDGSDYEFSIAVPYDSQYMEEDRHARSQRIRAFLDIMAEIAWDQALNNDLYAISDEVRDFLLQEQLKKGLREAMAENRIRGRSELLELALDPVVLVSEIMEEFEETCQNEDDHIMCALEAM